MTKDIPYRPEPHTEVCIYQPRVGLHPNAAARKWVGKHVTVSWRAPYFHHWSYRHLPSGQLEEVHVATWYGYVKELDRQVPASDLVKLPLLKKDSP